MQDSSSHCDSPGNLKLFKLIIFVSASLVYAAYTYKAWRKYDKGQVGMSISVEHISKLSLPDASICSLMAGSVASKLEAGNRGMVVKVMTADDFFGGM